MTSAINDTTAASLYIKTSHKIVKYQLVKLLEHISLIIPSTVHTHTLKQYLCLFCACPILGLNPLANLLILRNAWIIQP